MKNYLSMGNSKLKKSGIATFGIPAYKEQNGRLTCPMAKDCIKGCYANQGAYVWSNVKQAFQTRYELTKSNQFANIINSELKRRRSIKIVRIHDSGDFYSKVYLLNWIKIMQDNPNVQFCAYTKMVKLIKSVDLPSNFTVIFSYGGKQDNLINPLKNRHSMVFNSEKELSLNPMYIDASHDDLNALTDNHYVGLIFHGAKNKAWNTTDNKLEKVG